MNCNPSLLALHLHLCRQQQLAWRQEDLVQRQLDNARAMWARHVEKNRCWLWFECEPLSLPRCWIVEISQADNGGLGKLGDILSGWLIQPTLLRSNKRPAAAGGTWRSVPSSSRPSGEHGWLAVSAAVTLRWHLAANRGTGSPGLRHPTLPLPLLPPLPAATCRR